jgi:hypothetical protein
MAIPSSFAQCFRDNPGYPRSPGCNFVTRFRADLKEYIAFRANVVCDRVSGLLATRLGSAPRGFEVVTALLCIAPTRTDSAERFKFRRSLTAALISA